MGFIYKITNLINGKVYIGQTSRTIKERYKEHKKAFKKKNVALYCAMRKYGINNFKIEQIEKCDNTLLNEREIYWIAKYKSNNSKIGYNETNGGENLSTKAFLS